MLQITICSKTRGKVTRGNRNITILLTNNPQILKVAKSLLEDCGIEYFVRNNGVKGTGDAGNNVNDKLNGSVEIQVSSENSLKARTLLADLQELDFDEKAK